MNIQCDSRFVSRRAAGQRGVGMVEILVAMLVIALGLLGSAALTARTLSNNLSAYMRSQATMAAYDVIECLRANRAAALAGNYNVVLGPPPAGRGVASTDVANWKTNLAAALPSGDGTVTVSAQNVVSISITWNDSRTGNLITFSTQTTL